MVRLFIVMLSILLAAACQRPSAEIVHRSELHMGTTVTITVVMAGRDRAQDAIKQGFAEVAAMERIFSSYRADSELSRFNAQAGGGAVAVSADFMALLDQALEMANLTDGAFNPLVGPAVKLWGIPHSPRVPSSAELARLHPLLDLHGVTVDPKTGQAALAVPGMALGFGAIAKGYTADRVMARLRGAGASGAIVAVAGDIRVFGSRPDGGPWRIGVRDPAGGSEPLARIATHGGAISTSGNYERYFELDGVRYHHILDPRTLLPARGVGSVTVAAPDATRADALATALFVMGPQAGRELLAKLEGVSALFVLDDGQMVATAGWPGDRP